jgi:hypothetical protein
MPGKGNLQLTGKLGEVIRESAQIGLSWVRQHAYELGITADRDAQFLTDRDIHVHMPEGSIGKEGPSAGTALLSAFVSLFTKTQVNSDIGKCTCYLVIVWCYMFMSHSHFSSHWRDFTGRPSVACWRIKRENLGSPSSRNKNHNRTCCESCRYRGQSTTKC